MTSHERSSLDGLEADPERPGRRFESSRVPGPGGYDRNVALPDAGERPRPAGSATTGGARGEACA